MNPILENGSIQKHMGMEYIVGSQEIDMKVNGKNVSNMAKEQIYMPMVMYMLESIWKANRMDKENFYGQTDSLTEVSFKMVYVMEKEFGEKVKTLSPIIMKESTEMTRRMDMEFSNGLVEISTKVTF